jgi:AraC-like DNA-binding protein
LIIAVQGIFLCIHFTVKSKGIIVLNRLLAFICLCFALTAMNTYSDLNSLLFQNSLLQDIANNLLWFIGPSFYLYAIYNNEEPDTRFIIINTAPFLLPAGIDIFFNWHWFRQIVPFVGFAQIGIYLFLTIKYCTANYSKAKHFYNWILPSIIVFAVLLLLNFIFKALEAIGVEIFVGAVLQSFTSLLVIPVFYLAYKEMNARNDLGVIPKKYKTTHLSTEKMNEYLMRIESAMKEDKFYLNQDATLQTFSQYVNIPSKYISQVINQSLQVSFSEYLLNMRLAEVKKNLTDSGNKHLTIYGIAQKSGFNSSSRFNYLFKKSTGLTPKEFQNQGR